ncbi:MAG TPA: DUF3298 domain-containing protein [Candidatus Paceibacterota bacterium]|nr:DUF3298 domain-containing protein [Candidatus Paceibacterota bacterium]
MIKKKKNWGIKILFFLLIVAVVFAIYYFYKSFFSNESQNNSSIDLTSQKKILKVKDAPTISEETDDYSIIVTYPTIGIASIDTAVKDFIDEQITAYKKIFFEAVPPQDSSYKNYLTIGYSSKIYNQRILSYKFNIVYFTGGAHPNLDIQTKVFDINNQKELSLEDLFISNSDYLKTISDYVINQLNQKGIFSSDWINEGAGPDLENYKAFNVSDYSLVFYFDPYAVASYAEGEQKVEIPFLQIQDILNPEYFNIKNSNSSSANNIGVGLILDSLKENDIISSPLIITGSVAGQGWTGYEGQTGRVDLLDEAGNLLASSSLSALTNWMELPIKFSATLTFIIPKDSSRGRLVFYNENPSDKEENNKVFTLPIIFNNK